MATESLVFMPNGDVTLTLIRHIFKEEDPSTSSDLSKVPPLDQTAIDEDGLLDAASGLEAEAQAEAEEDSILFFAPDPPDNPNGPSYPPPPRAGRGSNASSRRDRSESPPASFWATLKRQAARVPQPVEDEQIVSSPPSKKPERVVLSSHEVQCIVSSRHMMLASRHFQTILTGDFNEAITLRTEGHVTIPLQDDLDSMVILLNIIHGAGRKVPRQVSLEVLSKLAVLVSKYEMLETVEFFSDTWIDNLQRGGLPKSYNENVLPLVFVFWVFDRPTEFKDMTRLAQRESTEKLEDDVQDIPILHSIIDAIKRDREFALETAITVIHAMIERYMAGQTICDSALDEELRYACDAMVLGCLMTSSRKIGIWPKPDTPFNGRKFKDLVKAIRSIRILDVCNKTSSRRWNSHGPSPNSHGLEDSIELSMKSIEAGLDGLKLSEYPKASEDYSAVFQTSPLAHSEEVTVQTTSDTREHFQLYMKEEITGAPQEEVKVPLREDVPVPPPHFSPRVELPKVLLRQESAPSLHFSPTVESPKFVKAPLREESSAPTPHFSPTVESPTVVKAPLREESSAPTPHFAPTVESPTVVKVPPREEFSPPLPHFSPRGDSPKMAASPKQHKQPIESLSNGSGRSSKEVQVTPGEMNEPVQEGVKVGPRQYSQEFQQSRVPVSPKLGVQEIEAPRQPYQEFQHPRLAASPKPGIQGIGIPVKEEVKAAPRYPSPSPTPSQKSGILAKALAKITDEPPRDQVKPSPSVVSVDEKFERILQPTKEVKPSTIEIKDTSNGSQTTTEAEDMWTPPKTLRMKKGKKTFSTRY